MRINRKTYLDKLHACWLGKNIGGTLGAPYEGSRNFLDVKGFTTKVGAPLPNDDLDLQLVWLLALEREGVKNVTSNVLAEYWQGWIAPHWNEYGVAKTNLAMKMLPPMSGEVDNEKWCTSNGAWIRSEIWAALTPGVPDLAVKYAIMDAIVDHGINEATYAEMYTAALESLAYVYDDLRAIIDRALSYIPEESIVAKTIRKAIDCYDNGIEYRAARDEIVEFTKELGWFQAPNNLGFVTIGLMYGEGDFKKSILYAVNCGDDTDCTAGTVGAILGIMGGTKAIPEDYKEFVGDSIEVMSINGQYFWMLPKTCSNLTDRIYKLVPEVMKVNLVNFEFTDQDIAPEEGRAEYFKKKAYETLSRSKYSYTIDWYNQYAVVVELDKHPRVRKGDVRKVTITFDANYQVMETRKLKIEVVVPNGWTVGSYNKTIAVDYPQPVHGLFGMASMDFEITVGERVEDINRVFVKVSAETLPYDMIIPVTFIG
jgi:ADP-ribosylglycohydrolase